MGVPRDRVKHVVYSQIWSRSRPPPHPILPRMQIQRLGWQLGCRTGCGAGAQDDSSAAGYGGLRGAAAAAAEGGGAQAAAWQELMDRLQVEVGRGGGGGEGYRGGGGGDGGGGGWVGGCRRRPGRS